MRTSRTYCAAPVSSMNPIPPCTWTPMPVIWLPVSVHQPLTVGMMDDRQRPLALRDGRLALDSRPGPLGCLLIRALADCVSFQSDRQARGVHHDKHIFQAAVGLSDQVPDSPIVVAV